MVMEFLSKEGVDFTEKNVAEDDQAAKELAELGSFSTPTVKIDDKVLIGFMPDELRAAIAE